MHLSGDGVNFSQVYSSSGWQSPYAEYTLDLDALCAANGIALDGDVYVMFRHNPQGANGARLYLDDVRIGVGDPNAPVLATPICATNGQFQFQLSGPVGTHYIVQASTNLINWIPIAVAVIPVSGVTNIVDPYATSYSRRFYRAVQFNSSLVTPRLGIPTRPGNGQVEFLLAGLVGSSQVIQASTTLSVWIPIVTNVIPGSGALLITDPDAVNYSHRFYRTLQKP